MNNLTSNPLYKRAQEMSQGKTPQELQQIAMNICREKGIDFNQALEVFKQQFGGQPSFK